MRDFSGWFGVRLSPDRRARAAAQTRLTITHLVPGQPLVHRLVQLRVPGALAPRVGVQVPVNVSHADRQTDERTDGGSWLTEQRGHLTAG